MAKKLASPGKRAPSQTAIENAIHVVRGQRIMLDSDLAVLYCVTTAAINQAVKRNAERFPGDFSYLLSPQDLMNLISQTVISSDSHGGRRKPPRAFTEHGVAMLSSVLRSPEAVAVNIAIMRTFVRLRRLMATPGELVEQLTTLAETVQFHDHQIKVIADVLQRMVEAPPAPKRKIGFHAKPSAE